MPRFRKKPVEIEAVRFKFIEDGCPIFADDPPKWLLDGFSVELEEFAAVYVEAGVLRVVTHQGVADVNPGDVLIHQIDGEIYPCRPELFAATYVPAGVMSFGDAIEAMREGERVARAGWNGKGMWVAMTPGSTFKADNARSGAALHVANSEPVSEITILPHIDMRAADGSLVIGWLASQTDMLARDWEIVS